MNRLISFILVLAVSGVSWADSIEVGRAKSATCAGCHGAVGISAIPMYPNLAGQKAKYIEKQLKAFRDGSREDPVMSAFAKSLTDEDIVGLAAFYESL